MIETNSHSEAWSFWSMKRIWTIFVYLFKQTISSSCTLQYKETSLHGEKRETWHFCLFKQLLSKMLYTQLRFTNLCCSMNISTGESTP
jgi:hypothetical protein